MTPRHSLTVFLLSLLLGLGALGAQAQSSAQTSAEPAKELSRECTFGDCENGYGTLEIKTTLGTDVYRGNFKDGKYHGNGKLTQMISRFERSYYDGNWDMGVRSGRGTFYNGRDKLYIGEWKNDKRNGHGAYFFGLKDWTENKYSEHWLAEHTENYTGDFVNDLYQGQGTYRWPDGQKYVGGFFANDKHGPGTFIYPSGTIRNQVWEYGDFVR